MTFPTLLSGSTQTKDAKKVMVTSTEDIFYLQQMKCDPLLLQSKKRSCASSKLKQIFAESREVSSLKKNLFITVFYHLEAKCLNAFKED